MRIAAASGDLSVGLADPSGGVIDLAAAGALFLGSTAANSGAIRLDGVDVRRYRLESLRSQINVVLQDTLLLRRRTARMRASSSRALKGLPR